MADQSEKTDDDAQGTGSEAEALVDILTWSQGCPEWQRDALRRLCTKDMLDDVDIDELTALCKNRGKVGLLLLRNMFPIRRRPQWRSISEPSTVQRMSTP